MSWGKRAGRFRPFRSEPPASSGTARRSGSSGAFGGSAINVDRESPGCFVASTSPSASVSIAVSVTVRAGIVELRARLFRAACADCHLRHLDDNMTAGRACAFGEWRLFRSVGLAGSEHQDRERAAGRPIEYPALRTSGGKPLRLEDVEVVAGAGAVPFNRKRFGGDAADRAAAGPKAPVSRRKRK
jgi:hypothetical protein